MNKAKIQGRKTESALIMTVMSLVLCAAIVLVPVFYKDYTDLHTLVSNAIDKSEAQESFVLQLTTASELSIGTNAKRTDITGYIVSEDNMEDVLLYLNTFSTSSYDDAEDYDVTVSLYSDGEKVYDNSTGKAVEVDVTAQEFKDIVSEFSLYRYSIEDAKEVSFAENYMEGYDKSGNVTVKLKTPSDKVLASYAQTISEAVGEEIEVSDLTLNTAHITYGVYYDMVTTQQYTFSVSCELKDGQRLTYTVTSQVSYNTELIDSGYEDYEYYIPSEAQEVKDNEA